MPTSLTRSTIAIWLYAFLVAAVVHSQAHAVGSEFMVNTYTVNFQGVPGLAVRDDGGFVVAWRSEGQDGSFDGVFARRFDAAGIGLAAEFQVNSFTTSYQGYPAVGITGGGSFVVVWQSKEQDGSDYGIFARRFSSAGVGLGAEFEVNSFTTGYQAYPAIGVDADGDFVVAWASDGQDGAGKGIFARRFGSAGAVIGQEFQVNSQTSSDQELPSVGMRGNGDFVVVWQSEFQDGDVFGVFARRFDSSGVALGVEVQVNVHTPGAQGRPRVSRAANGDFVIVWESGAQDGFSYGIFARRFASSGAGLGGELRVNSYTPSDQNLPAVGVESDGDFVVAWKSSEQDGSEWGVFGRRFDSSGSGLAAEFQVNSYTTSSQYYPALAMNGDGDFVVAWQSAGQDGGAGSIDGVFAQRYSSAATLDVDDDGAVGALTDGLLVLRFLFGFTGTTLTTGAVGGNCHRCDSGAIASYLQTLTPTVLDADGNGSLTALTDGLLVLRFLFGFTGTTLTTGAVDVNGCTRCDAPAIGGYLQTLL